MIEFSPPLKSAPVQGFGVNAGGPVSYGPDQIDPYRRAAGYVDRILTGAKPADLPVQAPTKYGLVINLKTAKALGLDVPATVLAAVTTLPSSFICCTCSRQVARTSFGRRPMTRCRSG